MTGVSSVHSADGRIGSAIRNAAARSGVDFDYLYNQARLESGFNPNIRARGSSATGLFQFLDQTWLAMIDRHGAANGMGWAANAVSQGANGRYQVSDPAMRRQIMDLRTNPEAASAMAAAYAGDNRAHLESRLGRTAESVDLYMAHFLGSGGATRFLRAHAATPDAPAAAMFPDAARANRPVFYDRAGRPRSFAQIRDFMADRLGVDGPMPARVRYAAAPAPAAPRSDPLQLAAALQDNESEGALSATQLALLGATGPATNAAVSPDYARIAYLMLAGLGAIEMGVDA